MTNQIKITSLSLLQILGSAVDVTPAFLGETTDTGTDGIWTNYDWTNQAIDVGVSNGVPYGLSDAMKQRINSPQVLLGQIPTDYETKENVARAKAIFTKDLWYQSFPSRNFNYTYEEFLRAIAKFPMFCGEVNAATGVSLEDACKRELATLLAHISYETNYLQGIVEPACSDPYNIKPECDYKSENLKVTLLWPPSNDAQYFGRGALLTQWNYRYGSFSDIAYYGGLDDKITLLESPIKLAQDGFLAFAAAVWTYMTPIEPMPSMHEVATGFYTPNAYDVDQYITQGFGTTTNIISEGKECNTADGLESAAALARATSFKELCTQFRIEAGQQTGCAEMGPFSTGNSASSFPTHWFNTGTTEFECEITDSVSGYSLYATRDYMRCVCDSWGEDVLECLVAVPDPTTSAAVGRVAALSAYLALIIYAI